MFAGAVSVPIINALLDNGESRDCNQYYQFQGSERIESTVRQHPLPIATTRVASAGVLSEHADDWKSLQAIAARQINPTTLVGAQIGPYRLVEVLGHGGMGVVFKAWQSAPFERHVALKLILKAPESEFMRAYFAREQRALARMNHPNVAVVHEAGFSPQGQPYFVMEFIDGVPLTRFCDANRLSVSERLRLFSEICMGVQHAHGKGILHRDLKPGNVLATRIDNRTVAKVIDFGVASILGDSDGGPTDESEAGGGTPVYMSPEQFVSPLDIDVRSDVYSLGVMLFELLTGTLPFGNCASSELLSKKRNPGGETPSTRIQQWHRDPKLIAANLNALPPTVIEELKPAMSASGSNPAEGSSRAPLRGGLFVRIAHCRAATVEALIRQCRGDLDRIVAKALAPDPASRYATPADLAEDILRHLRHEPIVAGPNSRTYRTRKFIRRNRAAVAGVGGVLGVSLIGAVVAGSGWRTAWLAEGEAQEQAARAENQTKKREGYQQLFATSLGEFRGPETRVRDVLDRLVDELDNHPKTQDPAVAAWARSEIGEYFYLQGDYTRSWKQLTSALEFQRAGERAGDVGACDDLRTTLLRAAQVAYFHRSDVEQARSLLDEFGQVKGATDAERLAALIQLGELVFEANDAESAERLFADAEDLAKLAGDGESQRRLDNDRAYVLTAMGEPALAEPRYRAAVAADRADLATPDHQRAMSINNLGLCLLYQGKIEEGEQLVREAEQIRRHFFGDDHVVLANSWIAFGFLELAKQNLSQSETWYRKALARQTEGFGEPHRAVAFTKAALAGVLAEQGRDVEAAEMLEASKAMYAALGGPVHPTTPLVYAYFRAMLHEQRGDVAGAERLYQVTSDLTEQIGTSITVLWANAMRGRAHCLYRQGFADKAQAIAASSIKVVSGWTHVEASHARIVLDELSAFEK